jgi:hypothetical protein
MPLVGQSFNQRGAAGFSGDGWQNFLTSRVLKSTNSLVIFIDPMMM